MIINIYIFLTKKVSNGFSKVFDSKIFDCNSLELINGFLSSFRTKISFSYCPNHDLFMFLKDQFRVLFFYKKVHVQSFSMRLLTLSWRRPLSYSNQLIDLWIKSMDWFLYDNGLRLWKSLYNINLRGRLYPFTCAANMKLVLSKLETGTFKVFTLFEQKSLKTSSRKSHLLTRSDNVLYINVGRINSIVPRMKNY